MDIVDINGNVELLRRFEIMNGVDCLHLLNRRQKAKDELTAVCDSPPKKISAFGYVLIAVILPGLAALTLYRIIHYAYPGSGRSVSADLCAGFVYLVGHVLANMAISRRDQKQQKAHSEKHWLAVEKSVAADAESTQAVEFCGRLYELREALGPKSDAMDMDELKAAVGKKLENSAVGILRLWKSSPRSFVAGKGADILKEFYDFWQVCRDLELVACSADTYIEHARSKES